MSSKIRSRVSIHKNQNNSSVSSKSDVDETDFINRTTSNDEEDNSETEELISKQSNDTGTDACEFLNRNNYCYAWIILPLILIALSWIRFGQNLEIDDKCQLDALKAKYPKYMEISQEISSIASSLKQGQLKNAAAVHLFLHNKTIKPETFINELAHSVAQCFESEEGELTLKDFKQCSDDYGCLIKQYKTNNKKVVVINNLNKMPIDMVPSLHFICDTIDPVIRPAFIFLNLFLTEHYDQMISIKKKANQELDKLWHEIDKNDRQAIIARVTDKVHLLEV